jgi:hypothetical protein
MLVPLIEALFARFVRPSVRVECQAPRNSAPSRRIPSAISSVVLSVAPAEPLLADIMGIVATIFYGIVVSWDHAGHYFSTYTVKGLVSRH